MRLSLPTFRPQSLDLRTVKGNILLLVTKTAFEDSKRSTRLQLTDVLAGATAEWAKGKIGKSERRDYCVALEKAGIAKPVIGAIWPIPQVERLEALPGEKLIDPLDFFGKVIIEAERKADEKNEYEPPRRDANALALPLPDRSERVPGVPFDLALLLSLHSS